MATRPEGATVPAIRLADANDGPVDAGAGYVLYWMTAYRRARSSFSLQHAVDWAVVLGRPLLVVETLDSAARWASRRHHAFVLAGMADNREAFRAAGVRYLPYVGSRRGEIAELVATLAERACLVVADDFPIREHLAQTAEVAGRIAVRLQRVDGGGLLPARAADRAFPSAHAFRRFLQRVLPDHLLATPHPRPLARAGLPTSRVRLAQEIQRRWPPIPERLLAADPAALGRLPIDPSVAPVPNRGGGSAARAALRRFCRTKLSRYQVDRDHPDCDGTSGLSPYLHFGHLGAHEVFDAITRTEDWSPERLSESTDGAKEGWWGMSESAEGFLDQLVTWRELGINRCAWDPGYDRFDSLPDWARATLAHHAADRREPVYSMAEFEAARTHDRLWNAAQRQLVAEGRLHNYLRMLWGKKTLQWSAEPEAALATMIDLNNKYALDGQDPNSYSGIFWILGRYDRPWGPKRPIFGTVRYMSSENTARKLRLKQYLARFTPEND